MSRHAPCPSCETTVNVVACLDAGRCLECGCPRAKLYELADGEIEPDEVEA